MFHNLQFKANSIYEADIRIFLASITRPFTVFALIIDHGSGRRLKTKFFCNSWGRGSQCDVITTNSPSSPSSIHE